MLAERSEAHRSEAHIKKEISTYIRAKYPILYICSGEEGRVMRGISEIAGDRDIVWWSMCSGLKEDGVERSTKELGYIGDPNGVLGAVMGLRGRKIVVLKDFHPFLDGGNASNVGIIRLLREVAEGVKTLPREESKVILIISPIVTIPIELKGEIVMLRWPLPGLVELRELVRGTLAAAGNEEAIYKYIEGLATALLGLSYDEAENCLVKGLISSLDKRPTSIGLAAEKRQVIEREGLVEWIDPIGGMERVGGLEVFKRWAKERREAFSLGAREYGLSAPKGVLLCGCPGGGKSLLAKVLVESWGMIGVKLDAGKLFGKYLGESEGLVRRVIELVEGIAPCILWIDELEKAFAGIGGGGESDGGASSRVFSTLLTWMQEKRTSVFVFCTANKVERLPPELLRTGRLDEIFFVDLPHILEREEIWKVHIRRIGRKIENFDIAELSRQSEGMTGAEIEGVLNDSMFTAYNQGEEVNDSHIKIALFNKVPLSKSMPRQIEEIREWAKGRAKLASLAPENKNGNSGSRFTEIGEGRN